MSPHPNLAAQLQDLIYAHFSLSDLQDLCLRLGVEYEDLPPDKGKRDKIRVLVLRLQRNNRLDDLLAFCTRLRPQVDWPDIAAPISLDVTPAPPVKLIRNPKQIFLSHAHQDSNFAHRLAADLRAHGCDIWIAPDSIRPGEKWVTAINRGLAESGIFLLVLTPDAANSRWVSSETDAAIHLEHQGEIHLLPLDLKPTTTQPLLATYQWISFRDDYKMGLEYLLQTLQPQRMAHLTQLYRQLQQYIGVSSWSTAQEVGHQIQAQYPDYRETDQLAALAQREAQRQQARQTEAEPLYRQLQAAMATADWEAALTLAAQIEAVTPDYRDVNQLTKEARRGRRQQQRVQWPRLLDKLCQLPAYVWGGGLLGVAALFLLLWLGGNAFGGDATPTPTPTRPAVVANTTPTPTAAPPSLMPTLTATLITMTVTVQAACGPPAAWVRYTVQIGDTLFSLAQEHNTTVDAVMQANCLSNSYLPTNYQIYLPPLPTTTTPTKIPTPNPQPGAPWTRPADGMVMVYVPGGTFMMGSDLTLDPNAEGDEFPQHEVTLSNFWMDQTEITNAMYTQCVTDTICTASSYAFDSNYNGANYPVVGISGNDATVYCEWVGGQLPTEAQWEYAARGEEGTLYPWGNEFDSTLANFCDTNCEFEIHDIQANDGYARTAPVGHYSPAGDSWVGAADMAGNVREWVANRYDTYEKDSVTNPIGPESGDRMVLRGGSWLNNSQSLRAAFRDNAYLHDRYIDIGFRCVVSPGS